MLLEQVLQPVAFVQWEDLVLPGRPLPICHERRDAFRELLCEVVDLGRFKRKDARRIAKEYCAVEPGSKLEGLLFMFFDVKRGGLLRKLAVAMPVRP